ncbi:MAG: hypothetical protein B7Y39_04550 [Bdellovibrio sp. 28-41-41]|nr:MAG: hypothetical protein B7Y39_04550 [Bdellovibrio sp. 28-41-41]
MRTEKAKSKIKSAAKMSSQRIDSEVKKRTEALLKLINNKTVGRKVRASHLFNFALGLITEGHINMLQTQSLTNEDRKELLRQKWTEMYGPITKDEFTGIMLTKGFSDFLSVTNGSETLDVRVC